MPKLEYIIHGTNDDNLIKILKDGYIDNNPSKKDIILLRDNPSKQIFTQLIYKDIPNENNFGYGYSKRLMGVQIEMFRKKGYNYSYIIPNNLYGEYEGGDLNKKHFIGALLEKIKVANENKDTEITLMGDGTPLRQFTFADDIAKIISLIINKNINENINVGIEENLTINEIATLALEATDSKHLKIKYDTTKPNGQYRKDISTSKFKHHFPDFQFTSYIDGMSTTYKSMIK